MKFRSTTKVAARSILSVFTYSIRSIESNHIPKQATESAMLRILLRYLALTSLGLKIMASGSLIPKKNPTDVQIMNSQFVKRQACYGYNSSSDPIRGVNLGGWFVLEPFITPSLFESFEKSSCSDEGIPVDEYHYCKELGQEEASRRLDKHWSSFYQERDFENIAAQGFNLVRIPVGYWAFDVLPSDPYVTGEQEKYLDRAIKWAERYNLKVWVDLHGAAGSQNGFDNSGLRDQIGFLENENINITLSVVKYLLRKYSQEKFLNTVVGVELLNEPLGPHINMLDLKSKLIDPAYEYLRHEIDSDQILVIHDAFQPPHYWDNFLSPKDDGRDIIIDHHHYIVFANEMLEYSIENKIRVACSWGSEVLTESHSTVAGEFSGALTDCTKWLNGVGRGARYDGSLLNSSYIGSCKFADDINLWSLGKKQDTRRFIEAQLDAFEMSGGWIAWTYRTERSIEWAVEKLIEYGMFPQPLTHRKYPNQCMI